MNNQVHSALSGTQTHKNLTDAFASEAKAAAKYRIFAHQARDNGDTALAKMLEDIAGNEIEHAELWMRYLGEIGDNASNLNGQIAAEEYETEAIYPEFASTAEDEGFSEIAEKLRFAANAEKGHSRLLTEYLTALQDGTLYHTDEDAEWLCTNCGYAHIGKQAPERCPLCSYPRGYYIMED